MSALRWKIGDVTITSVVETEGPTPPHFLFDGLSNDDVLAVDWLRPHFADDRGRFISRVQLLVIESQGLRIAVDTCVGNDKQRNTAAWSHRDLPFLQWMDDAGFDPLTVDRVVCTHLHVDHVGWNTRWDGDRWVPTFPSARYVFGRVELEHWRSEPSPDGPVFEDSVAPILEAGLADLVEPGHAVTDEITLESTPGHTPGHLSVRIRSNGDEAVITGDLMHHPIQVAQPTRATRFDTDAAGALATRLAFLEEQERNGALVIGTHFAAPTAGRIVRDGDAWRFVV